MNEDTILDEAIASFHLEQVRSGVLSQDVRQLLNDVEEGWAERGDGYGLELAERELSELWGACWLELQRELFRNGMLADWQLRKLDEVAPGWREDTADGVRS